MSKQSKEIRERVVGIFSYNLDYGLEALEGTWFGVKDHVDAVFMHSHWFCLTYFWPKRNQ